MLRKVKLSGWRRVAAAVWHGPNDPQIYGSMEVDATACLAFIARARAAGVHLTITHLVGRALAIALKKNPDLNVRLVGSKAIARPSVEVFFITAVGRGDLSGVKVEHSDEKSAAQIAREIELRAAKLRRGQDSNFNRSKRLMERLPILLARPLLHFIAWLVGTRGRAVPLLGLERSPFGSAMVSSIGMFGLPNGFSPISWLYRVPVLMLCGEVVEKPVAVDGKIESRMLLPLSATIDHRYADGWHIAALVKPVREYLANPAAFEPQLAAHQPEPQPTMQ